MSQDALLRSKSDAWVDHATPNANHGGSVKLRLRSDATNLGRFAHVHFKRPFELGDTIMQAKLRLYRRGDWATGNDLLVRRITESWREHRVTWNNRPASDGPSEITHHVAPGTDKDEIEIDVSSLVQDWADGDPCHGFRLALADNVYRALYASESPQDHTNPKLYVEWTQAPYPPSNLKPSGGAAVAVASPRLSWRFSDHSGSTVQAYSQVQVSATSDFSGSLLYDSGKAANTRHSWSLAGHYALSAGAAVWWRVRVWDGADFASGWSDPVRFVRATKGAVTILSPAAPPDNVVDDLTPVVLFAYAGGGALKRVRLVLSRIEPSGRLTKLFEFKEQAVDPTFNAITLERKRGGKTVGMIHTGPTYRVQLYAWDDVDRVHTQGDPPYAYAQRDFTYQRSGAPTAIETLSAVALKAGETALTRGKPRVRLTWTCASAPDWFCLRVDGVEVLPRIDPEDVATTTAGEYAMDFWRGLDGAAHVFEVERVVVSGAGSRQHSAGGPPATATVDVRGKWLVDEDDSTAVQIAGGSQPNLETGESGDTKFPVGGRRPIRVTDSIRGDEGSIDGTVTSSRQRDDFLELKGRMKELRYIQGKLNIPVRLGQSGAPPRSSTSDKDWWLVSTELFQIDDFFYVAGR